MYGKDVRVHAYTAWQCKKLMIYPPSPERLPRRILGIGNVKWISGHSIVDVELSIGILEALLPSLHVSMMIIVRLGER